MRYEEFTIEGKNQTKYLWVYPVQDKAGNISDDKTSITAPYLLQEYNFISTYTVSYNGNKFSTTAKVENGVTVTYDQDTSILTLNGNPTGWVYFMLLSQSFNENDQFKITLDYISGTFTSSGETIFVTDIKNSSNENVSTRNWADIFLPTATISNPSGILTTTSIGANEGSYLSVLLWMKSPSTTTFTNYKVKVNITKVDTKRVKYNHAYGTLGDIPTREGYTFDGWYTKEMGGTKVTSDTIVSVEGDHTLYAHWVSSKPTYTYTGSSQLIDDGNGNWRIKFLTSGTLTFTNVGNGINGIDVFLVGGGGSGYYRSNNQYSGGGGGGYTRTQKNVSIANNSSYNIVVGAGGAIPTTQGTGNNGQASSAFGYSASGGYAPNNGVFAYDLIAGGNGGSGGGSAASNGGSDGSNGSGTYGGAGQGTTTREFGESTGTLYSGGGGGGGDAYGGWVVTSGGVGGGGGGNVTNTKAGDGVANTGGGGGNAPGLGKCGSGGSGIVIIRNAR